ncbi:hypothetical protein EMCRGX_G000650 [Ephydatia muelleri]
MSLRTALKETGWVLVCLFASIVRCHPQSLELYHLLRCHNEDAVSVVANSAVTMLSEGGVGCSVKWGKKLYYGDVVASGRILDYGSGADDEVSSDAETPSQPVPATTIQPVPATTSQPVPATTIQPVPATTIQPVSATTSLHMLAQSHQSEPPRALCSPLRRSPSPRWSLSPPPLPSPYRPPSPVYPSDTNVVKAVQKMEASIVDAIRDLKEALLGKLDEIGLSGKPSWPARLPNNLTTPVSRPSPSVDQQASQYTPVPQPPLVPLPSAVLLSPITSGDSPRCLPIREGCNHLPSRDIEKTNLRPPEFTVQCHRNLTTESKIHTLALKLATESYFGPKANRVYGCDKTSSLQSHSCLEEKQKTQASQEVVNYGAIAKEIDVRIADLPLLEELRSLR